MPQNNKDYYFDEDFDTNSSILEMSEKYKGHKWGNAPSVIHPPKRRFGPTEEEAGMQEGYWQQAEQQPFGFEEEMNTWRDESYAQQFDSENNFIRDHGILGPSGENLPTRAQGWDVHGRAYYGEGGKAWWAKALDKVHFKDPDKEEHPNLASRTFSGVWSLAMDALDYGTTKAERHLYALNHTKYDVTGIERPTVDLFDGEQTEGTGFTGDYLPDGWADKLNDWNTGLENLVDGVLTAGAQALDVRPAVHFLRETPMSEWDNRWTDELMPEYDKNLEEGRLMYSYWVEGEGLRQEYIRRIKTGEDPHLLALELENPIAEAVGRAIIDPLNVVGWAVKAIKGVSGIRAAEKFVNMTPEVAKIFKAAGTVVNDAAGTRLTGEMAEAVAKATDLIGTSAKKIDEVEKSFGLFAWTADSKKAIYGRQMHNMGKQIFAMADDGEHAAELLGAMYKMGSKNTSEVADAIATINNSKLPQIFYSEAGMDMAVLMRKTIDAKGGTKKFLEAVTQAGKLTDKVGDKIDDVARTGKFQKLLEETVSGPLDTMFPDILQRAKAGESFKPWTLAAAKSYNRVKSPIGAVNKAFAAVYMGYSPGYAMRNMFTNEFHVFTDVGVRGVFRGGIRQWGAGHKIMDKAINDWLGFVPEGAKGFKTQASELLGKSAKKLPFSRLSEHFESVAARQVVHTAVEKTMKQMLRPGNALPSIKPLTDAGLDNKTVQAVWQSIVHNKGNVKAARQAFLQTSEGGQYIDVFKSLSWLSDQDKDFLGKFGILDELSTGIDEVDNAEELISRLETAIRAIGDDARKGLKKSVGGIDTGATQMVEGATVLEGAMRAGDITKETMSNLNWHGQQNKVFFDEAVNYITELQKKTRNDPIWTENFFGQNLADALKSDVTQTVRNEHDMMIGLADGFAKNVENLSPAETSKFFNEFGLSGKVEDFTPKQLRKKMWEEYFLPKRRQLYTDLRTEVFGKVSEITERIGGNVKSGTGSFDRMKSSYENALKWDGTLRGDEYSWALQRAGGNANKARVIANKFSFHTIVEEGDQIGANLDGPLLSIINKYGPVDDEGAKIVFESLDDVPYQVVDNAFTERFLEQSGMKTPWGRIAKARKSTMKSIKSMFSDAGVDLKFTPSKGPNGDRFFIQVKDDAGKFRTIGYSVDNTLDGHRRAVEALLDRVNMGTKTKASGSKFTRAVDQFDAVAAERWDEAGAVVADDAWHIKPEWQTVPNEIDDIPQGADIKINKNGERMARIDPDHKSVKEMHADTPIPPGNNAMPSPDRVTVDQARALAEHQDRLFRLIKQNFGDKVKIVDNQKVTQAVMKYFNDAEDGVAGARAVAAQVGEEAKRFALHNYEERKGFDLALGMVYPYAYWYSRTYPKWLQRAVGQNIGLVSSYQQYRTALEKVHAGAPDWWKYNINTTELGMPDGMLGISADNPVYFNLEATLNPVNGMTGVDFNDPYKRVNWWTKLIDDVGKFGPSVWTPVQYAVAVALLAQGEEEAASRWGGRLVPQTRMLKGVASKLGLNVKIGEGINEFDPGVHFFSGGLDPYERRRVGRALYQMAVDQEISYGAAADAAREQSGPLWQKAQLDAATKRMPGELAGFAFGVGFKGRNPADIEIDRYDQRSRRIWSLSEAQGPEWTRNELDKLNQQFPYGSLITLSRKAGIARDRAYSYDVLGRLPPGLADDILMAAGAPKGLYGKFYDTSGHIEKWVKGDRDRFVTAVVAAGGVFDMPDDATQAEWKTARAEYKSVKSDMAALFGEDIHDNINFYYQFGEDQAGRDKYMEANPQIADAMNYQDAMIKQSPTASAYYTSLDKMERYYRSMMYDAVYDKVGKSKAEMNVLWDGYNAAKLEGQGKQFWNANPELEEYVETKNSYEEIISDAYVRAGSLLGEPQFAPVRTDLTDPSQAQEEILQQMEPQETAFDVTWQQWQQEMSPQLSGLVADHLIGGERLTSQAKSQLERLAGQLDISYEVMLELMDDSISNRTLQ